jgi:hypothetical protein
MLLATRVKLVTAESPVAGIPGVKVGLFDRDTRSEDDMLGTEITDERGIARFYFDSKVYTDGEDQPAWQKESLPDLYVVVYDAQGSIVISTRSEVVEDKIPDEIVVPLSKELVDRHQLLPD